MFLAVERLIRLIEENGEDAFCSVCTKLDVPRLKPPELSFLNEYVSVVRPLAQALNILQAENKMFMGYLLPTVVMLREKLATKKTSATTCKPLITAMISGIDRRFHDVFNDAEASAAAILHPKFKMSWTDDKSMIDSGPQYIRHQLASSTSTMHCMAAIFQRLVLSQDHQIKTKKTSSLLAKKCRCLMKTFSCDILKTHQIRWRVSQQLLV